MKKWSKARSIIAFVSAIGVIKLGLFRDSSVYDTLTKLEVKIALISFIIILLACAFWPEKKPTS